MGRPPMGWAPAVFGRFLKPGLRMNYGRALYEDDGATLDELREAATTLEDSKRIAQRVFGGVHPITVKIESLLRDARAALRARETQPSAGGA